MAKKSPLEFEICPTLTPMTSPFAFRRGPPELPGFNEAVCCMPHASSRNAEITPVDSEA